jgi:hypothetical protein
MTDDTMTSAEQTGDTERVARSYFEAWTARETDAAAVCLAEGFEFTAGDMRIEGRDAFLDTGAFPEDATTTLVAEAYQGENGFQMYDTEAGGSTVRIVEHLVVRDGAIQASTFVTDMAAFMSLMSS